MSKNKMIMLPREVVEQALEALLNEGEFRKLLKPLIEKSIDSIRDALEQPDAGPPVTAPEGWKLVPVEPKISMKQAALNASRRWAECDAPLPRTQELWASEVCWKAMIEAAPHPPTVKECLTVQPQVEREPVAWIRGSGLEMLKLENGGCATVYASDGMSNHSHPLYTRPQPKPLTDEAVLGVAKSIEIQFDSERLNEQIDDILAFARAIERTHGIGGDL